MPDRHMYVRCSVHTLGVDASENVDSIPTASANGCPACARKRTVNRIYIYSSTSSSSSREGVGR